MSRRLINKSVTIRTNPKAAFRAFVDPNQLISWLHAHSAVVALCKNGPYGIGWNASDDGDFYVCCGKIKSFVPNKLLKISELTYFFSNRKKIGPLNLSFSFQRSKNETLLSLHQYGAGTGKDWDRNFDAVYTSWEEALYLLRTHFEKVKTND
jgi:uncharacterized protein YndB with AHSA1/START domain